MHRQLRNNFCFLGLYLLLVPLDIATSFVAETRCRYDQVYKMLQANCSNMDWDAIPPTLNRNIEVLIMSKNWVRTLEEASFEPYSNLVYLYLSRNAIGRINDETFKYLQYLQAFDISVNALTKLPPALLKLPALRNLYIAMNFLTDDSFPSEVSSPLEYLGVQKNELKKVPMVGKLPTLVHLNISDNKIERISTEDISSFCSLKILDLRGNPVRFDSTDCECHLFNSWIKTRNMIVEPNFTCSESMDCTEASFSNATIESFKNCTSIVDMRIAEVKAKSTWITVGSCLGAFIFVAAIVLYCIHKRNKKRAKKRANAEKIAASNANTELLNSNLTEHP